MSRNQFYDQFGTWVKSRRLALNLTQDELSDLSGVSRPTISKIEASKVEVLSHNMLRLCRALDISVTKLANMIPLKKETR